MNKCKIIEDLLPLYYDEICSEDSKNMVEKHLQECSECTRKLEELKSSKDQNNADLQSLKDAGKKLKRMRRVGMAMGSGVLAIFTAIMIVYVSVRGLSWGLDYLSNKLGDSYHTTDKKEYLQTGNHVENEGLDIDSGLFVFPESIDGLKNVEYEYYCDYGWENSYMFYLKATYPDEESYKAEIERLKNISCTVSTRDGDVVNTVEYSEEWFDYPAYVTVYNTNLSFEYALADVEENTVVYVYLKLMEGAIYIPEKYLPIEFRETSMMDYDMNWSNPNIYWAPDGADAHVYYLD